MNRLRWLALLMGVAILGITSFQLYWLKQNYAREKKSLTMKSELNFRETIFQLQVGKLKLDDVLWKGKIEMHDENDEQVSLNLKPRKEIVSTINVISGKLKDSLNKNRKSRMIISMNQISTDSNNDSIKVVTTMPGHGNNKLFNLLYRVDSLQDSLKLSEITRACSAAMKEQKLNIPFIIERLDTASDSEEQVFNEVTTGFAHPVTYKMKLGNTFPYLLKQITQPILFSILLLGITVLSFALLYRNLLKQQRLATLKNEFISNITHELKTPIATVGVAIEALRNFGAAQSPEKTKEYLDISATELQRLGLMVDKVLKISMLEKRKIELKKENFDIRELVQEVMNSMKLQFEKYEAKVNMILQGDSFIIEADRLHISSVIYNLLDNALKYSKENPVIDVYLSSLPNEIIELKVSDNGTGITKEYQSKVFDKFFRVPAGNMHNVKGYGLGLSYVKEIVTAHIGYITVESEPGKGSTFTIKLPFKEVPVIYFDDKRRKIKEKN